MFNLKPQDLNEQKRPPEVFYKKGVLKTQRKAQQNSNENICAKVFFFKKMFIKNFKILLIKTLLKRDSGTGVFL